MHSLLLLVPPGMFLPVWRVAAVRESVPKAGGDEQGPRKLLWASAVPSGCFDPTQVVKWHLSGLLRAGGCCLLAEPPSKPGWQRCGLPRVIMLVREISVLVSDRAKKYIFDYVFGNLVVLHPKITSDGQHSEWMWSACPLHTIAQSLLVFSCTVASSEHFQF